MGRERRCGAGAAAVMDAWVRFSAQSQARERLCRCGPWEWGEGGHRGEVGSHCGVSRGQLGLRGPARTAGR